MSKILVPSKTHVFIHHTLGQQLSKIDGFDITLSTELSAILKVFETILERGCVGLTAGGHVTM